MRVFTLEAKLRAEVMTRAEMPPGDVIAVGEFQHPLRGKFSLVFSTENPPRVMIMHSQSQRIGVIDIQPMIEAVAKQVVTDG